MSRFANKSNISTGDAVALDASAGSKTSLSLTLKTASLLSNPDSITLKAEGENKSIITFKKGSLIATLTLSPEGTYPHDLIIADDDRIVKLTPYLEQVALNAAKQTLRITISKDLKNLTRALRDQLEDGTTFSEQKIIDAMTHSPFSLTSEGTSNWNFKKDEYEVSNSCSSINLKLGGITLNAAEVMPVNKPNFCRFSLIIPEEMALFLNFKRPKNNIGKGIFVLKEFTTEFFSPIHVEIKDLHNTLRNNDLGVDSKKYPYLKFNKEEMLKDALEIHLRDNPPLGKLSRVIKRITDRYETLNSAFLETKLGKFLNQEFKPSEQNKSAHAPITKGITFRSNKFSNTLNSKVIDLKIAGSRLSSKLAEGLKNISGLIYGFTFKPIVDFLGNKIQDYLSKKLEARNKTFIKNSVDSLAPKLAKFDLFFRADGSGSDTQITAVVARDSHNFNESNIQLGFLIDDQNNNSEIVLYNRAESKSVRAKFKPTEMQTELLKIIELINKSIKNGVQSIRDIIDNPPDNFNLAHLVRKLNSNVTIIEESESDPKATELVCSTNGVNSIELLGSAFKLVAQKNEDSSWQVILFGSEINDNLYKASNGENPILLHSDTPMLIIGEVRNLKSISFFNRMLKVLPARELNLAKAV